jgi:hypothetical protein
MARDLCGCANLQSSFNPAFPQQLPSSPQGSCILCDHIQSSNSMPRSVFLLAIVLTLATRIHARPAEFFRILSFTSKSERSWSLWGWAWGAESTVSIVDRSPTVSFASRPAAFGPESTDPILGYVIPLSSFTAPCDGNSSELHTAPNLGCPTLCVVGPHEPEPKESWIALVQRGKCQFVDKVREAQRLGAKGVVVGGDDPDIYGNPDMLVNMYSPCESNLLYLIGDRWLISGHHHR